MLTLEDRREFFRDYPKLVALFGEALVDRGLLGLNEREIVETYDSPLDGPGGKHYYGKCYHTPNRFLGTTRASHRFYQGGWERTEKVPVNQYLVPNQHQSLAVPKVIRPALFAIAPWLVDFKLDIYAGDEFYVRLAQDHKGHRSLYVPYRAFVDKDADTVVRRNLDYLKWYTKGDEIGPAVVADEVSQAFLGRLK